MRVVAGRAHGGDDLLNFGGIGGIADTLVSRRSPSVEAGHGRRRSASTSAVKQDRGHGPSSGSENKTEHPSPATAPWPKQQRDRTGATERRLPPLVHSDSTL